MQRRPRDPLHDFAPTQARSEKLSREKQREAEAEERLRRGRERREEAMKRRERSRAVKADGMQRNSELVRAVREEEAVWQEEREERQQQFYDEARKRVIVAKNLDARLDAQEAAQARALARTWRAPPCSPVPRLDPADGCSQDAVERADGSRDRANIAAAVEVVRRTNLQKKRENVERVKKHSTRAQKSARQTVSEPG